MQVRQGRSLTVALSVVDGELRPGVQALSFQVLRRLGTAQALRGQLAKRAPPEAVDALLCVALALAGPPDGAPYEAFTLVDQAVEAAKQQAATRAQASFINACLRRFLRERDTLEAACSHDLQSRWNHPLWWIRRLRKDWPTRWQDILRANNAQAPLVLRVNCLQISRGDYLQVLSAAGIAGVAVGEQGVLLQKAQAVPSLPGFDQGCFSVQDSAAQLAASLLLAGLDRSRPLRILDACAAPGGKTGHLLEMLGPDGAHQVTALDVDAARCQRIEDNLARLKLTARVLCADAAQVDTWWDGEPLDAILLDAPCTASGIVRRHPDVRWLRRESDVDQLAAISARLLQSLWALLKPGGRMLFCTCSVFRAEGEEQIQTFVASNTEAVRLPSPGHLMPQSRAQGEVFQDNPKSDQDGFYYALLQKPGP
jgi:16S rRNA (cytosine967-C5)-methyltransferase